MSKHQLALNNSQVPEGYKKTEVGVIPEKWKTMVFSEIASCRKERIDPRKSGTQEFCIELEHIESGTGRLLGNTQTGYQSSLKAVFQPGDVLFGKLRSYLRKYWLADREGVCSTEIWVLVANSSRALSEFLYQIVTTEQFIDIASIAYGTHMPRSDWNLVKNYNVAVPPVKEQCAIAQTLSDVDGLIAALDQVIAKKRNIKTATMQELLTGKKRLPGFGEGKGYKNTEVGVIPKDWDVASLVDVSINGGLVRGPFGGALKKEFFVKSGYKVYEQRNAIYRSIEIGNYFIDSKKFNDLRRFKISEGDLIVSCSGTIGCIYKIPEGAPQGVINQALLKITLNNNLIDSNLFLAVFCCDKFQEKITENSHGGAMQNLVEMDTFKNTLLQLPSFLEQKAIASILSDMDAEIAALEKRRAKTKAMKQGIMQELLTGKTRLIVPNNP